MAVNILTDSTATFTAAAVLATKSDQTARVDAGAANYPIAAWANQVDQSLKDLNAMCQGSSMADTLYAATCTLGDASGSPSLTLNKDEAGTGAVIFAKEGTANFYIRQKTDEDLEIVDDSGVVYALMDRSTGLMLGRQMRVANFMSSMTSTTTAERFLSCGWSANNLTAIAELRDEYCTPVAGRLLRIRYRATESFGAGNSTCRLYINGSNVDSNVAVLAADTWVTWDCDRALAADDRIIISIAANANPTVTNYCHAMAIIREDWTGYT